MSNYKKLTQREIEIFTNMGKRTFSSVAEDLGVSINTACRRHKLFLKEEELKEEQRDGIPKVQHVKGVYSNQRESAYREIFEKYGLI